MDINLISVYKRPDRLQILFELLSERSRSESISHKEMPTPEEHVKFVESKPYKAWYFIECDGIKGACYLSKRNEIGVFIFKQHQGFDYGKKAVTALIKKHGPGRYLANINPGNNRSLRMFGDLGFELCQYTYELAVP